MFVPYVSLYLCGNIGCIKHSQVATLYNKSFFMFEILQNFNPIKIFQSGSAPFSVFNTKAKWNGGNASDSRHESYFVKLITEVVILSGIRYRTEYLSTRHKLPVPVPVLARAIYDDGINKEWTVFASKLTPQKSVQIVYLACI